MDNTIELNITEQVIELDITNEIIEIEAPMGAYSIPSGLPQGGTAGQILEKIDNVDFNAHWITPKPDFYIHNQQTSEIEWQVTHNLDKFPSVSVVDSANDEVIGEVSYINSNSLTIKFTAPFSGKAYLN